MLATEHPEDLAADFWTHYGRGWEEMLDTGTPIDRVADLASRLPRESRLMLSLVPRRDIEDWSVDTYLLAHLADLLAAANWQRSGAKGQRPKPVARPKPVPALLDGFDTAEEFRSWYAQQPGGRQLNN